MELGRQQLWPQVQTHLGFPLLPQTVLIPVLDNEVMKKLIEDVMSGVPLINHERSCMSSSDMQASAYLLPPTLQQHGDLITLPFYENGSPKEPSTEDSTIGKK